jgi:hypothetical protein
MKAALSERAFRRALIAFAVAGLLSGFAAWAMGRSDMAQWCWAGGTIPVVAGLLVSMIRDFLAGRLGVDAVAFVSMSGALALGQNLAGIVIALMYAGGNALEDFAVARAERDLRSLIDRAPKIAHRQHARAIEDVPVEQVAVGDDVLVRAGEVIPMDGVIVSPSAILDEAAVTGEPIPVTRQTGELARSGSLNAGETFELRATTTARESTYAGIVRMVSAAQTAKAPFVRMADRFALLLVPLTLLTAGGAWFFSGDPIRALAVLVASTPCPLILAAVKFCESQAHSSKPRITWLPPRWWRLRWPKVSSSPSHRQFTRPWVPGLRVSSRDERCVLDRINWFTAPASRRNGRSAAVVIAKRTQAVALQSIVAGMGLSAPRRTARRSPLSPGSLKLPGAAFWSRAAVRLRHSRARTL